MIAACIKYVKRVKFFDFIDKILVSFLYKNAFFLILNSAVNSILGFVFWNVMAHYFSPKEVGIGSSLVTASVLVGTIANLGLGIGLIRYIPEVGKGANKLINSSFTLAGIVAIAGSIIYIFGIKYWSTDLLFLLENNFLLLLFAVFSIITALSLLTDQALVAGRSARHVFFKNGIINIIKIPLPLVVFNKVYGFGIFCGTGIATLLGIAISWRFFLPAVFRDFSPIPSWQKEITKKVLPYACGNYLANLFNGLAGLVFPLMALKILGPEKSAFLYIAWMMSMVLAIIPNGMAQSLFAEGSHDQSKLIRNVRRALLFSIAISIPAVGIMIVLSGWLLDFFGQGYKEHGTVVMRFLVLAVIPQCVNVVYITINQVRKKVHLIIIQTVVLSIIALGLGYWLLYRVGLPGLGIAYALAHWLVALIVVWPLKKIINEKLPQSQ